MVLEADDGLPTTTTGSSLKGEAIAALRWVYPSHHLVTALTGSVTIGRSPACTTALESSSVSRQHAEVKSVSGAWVIRDLDSKNGVFVNAKKVREAPLRIGDVVRLGDWVGVVEVTTLDGLSGFRDLGQGVLGGAVMLPVVEQVKKAALDGSALLLVGETGTGKALLARALHRFAARKGPFVVFDGAAGSEDVREAELFGGSGAPTEPTSAGQIHAARAGTLLLDSPFDLPVPLQARLARLLERRAAALADKPETALDVRVVAKTTALLEELPPGRIDTELRRLFAGSIVRVPALRERRADVVPLFLELVRRHGHEGAATIEPDLVERLCLNDWPMNVRELDRKARRFIVDGAVDPAAEPGLDASQNDRTTSPPARRFTPSYPASEIQALRAALERHQGNLSKAADELEITRSKAYRMLKSAR